MNNIRASNVTSNTGGHDTMQAATMSGSDPSSISNRNPSSALGLVRGQTTPGIFPHEISLGRTFTVERGKISWAILLCFFLPVSFFSFSTKSFRSVRFFLLKKPKEFVRSVGVAMGPQLHRGLAKHNPLTEPNRKKWRSRPIFFVQSLACKIAKK